MDKKITEDLLAVDLQDYYHALKKRDKGKLLHYLMDKYLNFRLICSDNASCKANYL